MKDDIFYMKELKQKTEQLLLEYEEIKKALKTSKTRIQFLEIQLAEFEKINEDQKIFLSELTSKNKKEKLEFKNQNLLKKQLQEHIQEMEKCLDWLTHNPFPFPKKNEIDK